MRMEAIVVLGIIAAAFALFVGMTLMGLFIANWAMAAVGLACAAFCAWCFRAVWEFR